ncbi:MAG: flagellar motor protein MotB [Desulfuromonadales bacterium]|nr:flagellar motor protein MotB [Desulfuromonadales bacterium]
MALKREPEKHANHERWLVSYGDLLTLLFAVFVVLYAMSQADKKKAEEVTQSIQSAFGMPQAGGGGKPIVIQSGAVTIIPDLKTLPSVVAQKRTSDGMSRKIASSTDYGSIKTAIDAYLVKAGMLGKVGVEITHRGVVVSLNEAGFFDSGSAHLKKESIEVLSAISDTLNQYANTFRVEGHTDNVPIKSSEFRSNWELSTARATNVVHFLVESAGFSPQSVSAVGYGEYRPTNDNNSIESRAKNRRVDIVLLSTEAERGEARIRLPDKHVDN